MSFSDKDSVMPTLVNLGQETALTLAITLNDEEAISIILTKSESLISMPNNLFSLSSYSIFK